jgi:hypothetical protein
MRVLATDLCSFLFLLMCIDLNVFPASAIELIDHNVSTNKSAYPHVDLKSLVLDWDDDRLPPQVLGRTDIIVYAKYLSILSLAFENFLA